MSERKSSNFVLYRIVDNRRQPIFSTSSNDESAARKIRAEITQATLIALNSGFGHPDFSVVLETRAANEAGVQISDSHVECDAETLQPIQKGSE